MEGVRAVGAQKQWDTTARVCRGNPHRSLRAFLSLRERIEVRAAEDAAEDSRHYILVGRHGGRPSTRRVCFRHLAGRIQGWQSRGEREIDNRYLRTATDDLVKLNDVARTHADTAVARRSSDVSFFRCAVNINGARVCIRILRFAAAQPKNTGHNRVASRCINGNDFARAPSILEDSAEHRTVANLVGDLQFAERCAIAAKKVAQPKFGSRDWIDCHELALIEQGQLLFARADDNVMLRVRRDARAEKKRERDKDKMEVDWPLRGRC